MFKCVVNSWVLLLFVAQLGFPLIYGLNLALGGSTKQSSIYKWKHISTVSSNVIDGDRSGDLYHGSCAHTDPGDPKPNLNLTFVKPVTIKKVVLYNRFDGVEQINEDKENKVSHEFLRLKGFILKGFSSNNSELFKYTDTNPNTQYVYTVNLGKPVAGVAMINVEATNTETGSKILNFCELEVY